MAARKPPPKPSRFEIATRRIDESAKAVVEAETALRAAKVKRLRIARLEREASEAWQKAAAPAAKPARKATAKAKPG